MDSKNNNSAVNGFSAVSQTRIFWNSRKRSAVTIFPAANGERETEDALNKQEESPMSEEDSAAISERRKALFEPLEPTNARGKASDELLVPPPDFDTACYPKGWLIGKKRKLVNVDVVESMRRIAVQEMNRKDREINGLSEQLEEDAKILEHLQLQLLQERSKRVDVERENSLLQNQVSMLMNMLQDTEADDDDEQDTPDS